MEDPAARAKDEPIARAKSERAARAAHRRLQRARPSGRYEVRPTEDGFGIYEQAEAHLMDPMGPDVIALGGDPLMLRYVARCVCGNWHSPAERTENEALASFARHAAHRQQLA